MKNWPVFIQITTLFTILIIGTGLLLLVLLPATLRGFFTEEIYSTIENAQKVVLTKGQSEIGKNYSQQNELQSIRSVNHVIVDQNGRFIKGISLKPINVKQLVSRMNIQNKDIVRLKHTQNRQKIFVVAQQINDDGKTFYFISYMWDTYRNELVQTLFKRIMQLLIIIYFVSILISLAFAKRLTQPLVVMKSHVQKLAKRKWNQPLVLERKDELGELAEAIEQMRIQLIKQDNTQQTFMQNVSHDLKTPVMVIQNYAQAIEDGIYENKSLQEPTNIIKKEAQRLEHKIQDLLYLTKLKYLETKQELKVHFSMNQLIEDVVSRLKSQRRDIAWEINLCDHQIKGNISQWEVALENIINNCIRFTNNEILIKSFKDGDKYIIQIHNDGPSIPNDLLSHIFEPFTKGKNGSYGLGLVISKKIIEDHSGKLQVNNKEIGVIYEIMIPN
jgi:two-component system, OmpR family, sensor histidine kinase CssS